MLIHLWHQDSTDSIGKSVGQTISNSQDPGRINVYLDSGKYSSHFLKSGSDSIAPVRTGVHFHHSSYSR